MARASGADATKDASRKHEKLQRNLYTCALGSCLWVCVCLSWWVFFLLVFFAIFLGLFLCVCRAAHYKCVLNEVKASRKTSRNKKGRGERTHTHARESKELVRLPLLSWLAALAPGISYLYLPPPSGGTPTVSIISIVINSRRRRLSWLCSSIFKISEALLICYLCARWLWMIMIYAQTQTHAYTDRQTHTHPYTHSCSYSKRNWSWSGSTLASARCRHSHRRWSRDTRSLSDVCHEALRKVVP